jgi:hypothetical protein
MTCATLLIRLCVRLQRQGHLPQGVLTQRVAPCMQVEGSQKQSSSASCTIISWRCSICSFMAPAFEIAEGDRDVNAVHPSRLTPCQI